VRGPAAGTAFREPSAPKAGQATGTHVVGRAGEIQVGGRQIVSVGGREIGVFNVGGRFYALLNECAHLSGPACTGGVLGELTAEVLPEGEVREFFTQEGEFEAAARRRAAGRSTGSILARSGLR
jgi:nitrite reductase/ring-hydroxylating ferredoxin subunit